nr:OmpH family outer membrane protein [Sodalis sp. CWE]
MNLGFTITSTSQAADKIAIVDISSIFQQLPQRETVAKKLEDEFKKRATELQSMERDLKIKMQQLQLNGSNMEPDARISLEKSLIAQRDNLSTKAHAFEQDNRRRQTEERDKILNCIQEAVRIVATKKNYDIVINANAIAYANNAKDITNDVLKQVK